MQLRQKLSVHWRNLLKRLLAPVIEQVIGDLLQKVRNRQPNLDSPLNMKLMDLEIALRNINQLSEHVASQLYPGLAGKTIAQPPALRLPSKLCTKHDFASDWLGYWAREMNEPFAFHRNLWEFCYIAQSLYAADMMRVGRSGIGFGCGREPLSSLFAKYGASVLATDLAPMRGEAAAWRDMNMHAAEREAVLRREICPDYLLNNIEFRFIDMNEIPAELNGRFDFCWTSCAMEHLGSIERGLAFVERSLELLKPGGVAVHTTEFALDPGDVDHNSSVAYQPADIAGLAERLQRKGAVLEPPDFDPGDGILDRLTLLAPMSPDVFNDNRLVNLKVSLAGFVGTSFGLLVTKSVVSDLNPAAQGRA